MSRSPHLTRAAKRKQIAQNAATTKKSATVNDTATADTIAGASVDNTNTVNQYAGYSTTKNTTKAGPAPTNSKTAHDEANDHSDASNAFNAAVQDVDTSVSTVKETKQTQVKTFQGTATGFGTTVERPEDATQDEQWHCGNRSCTTGQTWKCRDGSSGSNGFGRKVISNFFGRNKKQTSSIDTEVWHHLCRKCYQRQSYGAKKSEIEACRFYLNNLETQLDRIMLWRPDARFRVQLSKGARDRLSKYFKELSKTKDKNVAKAAMHIPPQTKTKGSKTVDIAQSLEDAFDIEQMKYFDETFCNDNTVYIAGARAILKWISDSVEAGDITSMPPFEFLINSPVEGELIHDAANNYNLWCTLDDEKRDNRSKQVTNGNNGSENVQDSTEEQMSLPGNSQQGMLVQNGETTNSTTPVSDVNKSISSGHNSPRRYRFRLVSPHTKPASTTLYASSSGSNLQAGRRRSAPDDDDDGHDERPAKRPRLRLEIPSPDPKALRVELVYPPPQTVQPTKQISSPEEAMIMQSIEQVVSADRGVVPEDPTALVASPITPRFVVQESPVYNTPIGANWRDIFPPKDSRANSWINPNHVSEFPDRVKRAHSEPVSYRTRW